MVMRISLNETLRTLSNRIVGQNIERRILDILLIEDADDLLREATPAKQL